MCRATTRDSEFRRESPTVLVISRPGDRQLHERWRHPADHLQRRLEQSGQLPLAGHRPRRRNDVGRVNMPVEKRETETTGGRFAVTWGDDDLNLKVGGCLR